MYLDTAESAAARSAALPSASVRTAGCPAPLARDRASPTAHARPLGEQPQRSEPTVPLGEQPQGSQPPSLPDPQHSQIPGAGSRRGGDLNARLAS